MKAANLRKPHRILALLALLVIGLLGVNALDPIAQNPNYHQFADQRNWLGIPNANDVVSNSAFAVVGILGLVLILGNRRYEIFSQPTDTRPYLAFFLAVTLISVGSAYYHWAPSNERLFWDRLPMSVAFMAFCAAIIADRISAGFGNSSGLVLLMTCGASSVVYWHWTETMGRGDLRFYIFVQFYPIILLPLILWLFPAYRYTAGRYLFGVVAIYAASKVLEHFDHQVFELLLGTVSGHTLKHLTAAAATGVVLAMLTHQNA